MKSKQQEQGMPLEELQEEKEKGMKEERIGEGEEKDCWRGMEVERRWKWSLQLETKTTILKSMIS